MGWKAAVVWSWGFGNWVWDQNTQNGVMHRCQIITFAGRVGHNGKQKDVGPTLLVWVTLWVNLAANLYSCGRSGRSQEVAQHCKFRWFCSKLFLYPYDCICKVIWPPKQNLKGRVTILHQTSRNCNHARPYGTTLGRLAQFTQKVPHKLFSGTIWPH